MLLSQVVLFTVLVLMCFDFPRQAHFLQASRLDRGVFDQSHSLVLKISDESKKLRLAKGRRNLQLLLDRIDTGFAKIEKAARSQIDSKIPEEYFESLRLDLELLKGVAQKLSNSAPAFDGVLDSLSDVADDLEAKVAFSENALGAGFRLVDLIVHTKRDALEMGGYEVWYVPKGWSDTPAKFRVSDQPSSPAILKLAPGNYWIWLKKGEMSTQKLPYTLGRDGSRKEIDFPIP